MNDFDHGMLTQVYRLIEADARPLSESWYIGRDIGRVGWLTPVRVFDTDGLFTPDVVSSEAWQESRVPDAELAGRAFDRPVVMTELMQGWAQTVMRSPELRRRFPSSRRGYAYVHRRDRDGTPPTPQQIRVRYQHALAQMPSGYFVQTLYGEAVGAALARRASLIEEGLDDVTSETVPEGLAPEEPVRLDEVVESLGCRVEPEVVSPGGRVQLSCYFRAIAEVERDYRVFVHLRGPSGDLPSNGDHEPQLGFVRTSDWEPGVIQRDVSVFTAPGTEDAEVQVRFGLYRGGHRAVIGRPEAGDEVGRIRGPTFRVQPAP